MTVWKNENGENNFSLQAKPSKQSSSMANSYYSMALSDDNRMGNDFVVDCLVNSNGRVMVDLSHNIGKSNEPLSKRERMDILQEQTGQFIDGIVHCKWRLKRQFRIGNKDYDISKRSYHIFLATGSYDNDGEQNHKEYHDLKLRTSEPVNLSSIIAGSLQVKDLTVLIRVHGKKKHLFIHRLMDSFIELLLFPKKKFRMSYVDCMVWHGTNCHYIGTLF